MRYLALIACRFTGLAPLPPFMCDFRWNYPRLYPHCDSACMEFQGVLLPCELAFKLERGLIFGGLPAPLNRHWILR